MDKRSSLDVVARNIAALIYATRALILNFEATAASTLYKNLKQILGAERFWEGEKFHALLHALVGVLQARDKQISTSYSTPSSQQF
jgi:hypothetical protein